MSTLKLIAALLGVIDYAENETMALEGLLAEIQSPEEPRSTEAIECAYEAIDELFLASSEFDHSWKTAIDHHFEKHPEQAPLVEVFDAAHQEVMDLFGFNDIQAMCLVDHYFSYRAKEKVTHAVIDNPDC